MIGDVVVGSVTDQEIISRNESVARDESISKNEIISKDESMIYLFCRADLGMAIEEAEEQKCVQPMPRTKRC